MSCRQRDVDVARLADRLAVVEALQDGELARPLLHDASDPEEVLRPLGTRHRTPDRLLGAPGRFHGPIDIFKAGSRDLREHFFGGGILSLVGVAVHRLYKGTVDEQPVGRAKVHDGAGLRRRGVLEDLLGTVGCDEPAWRVVDPTGLIYGAGPDCTLALVGWVALGHSMLKSSLPA